MLFIPRPSNRKGRMSAMRAHVSRGLYRGCCAHRAAWLPHRGSPGTCRSNAAMCLNFSRNLCCSCRAVLGLAGSSCCCGSPIHSSTQYQAEEDHAKDFYRSRHRRIPLIISLQSKCLIHKQGLNTASFDCKNKTHTVPLLGQCTFNHNRFIIFHAVETREYPIRPVQDQSAPIPRPQKRAPEPKSP
jgi:hypothetical protein